MDPRRFPPGWNDPPLLNYNASNPPPKSRIINKRIAFPLNNPSTTKSPLMSSIHAATPPKIQLSPAESTTPDLLENLKKSLDKFFKHDEDRHIFCDLWKDGKFPAHCQENICLLSKYLVENNIHEAQEVKNKLLTQYEEVCGLWLKNIEL